jgi:hypothetical protein
LKNLRRELRLRYGRLWMVSGAPIVVTMESSSF